MIIRVFVVICLNFRKISCLFIVVNRQEWLDINRHKHWPLHPIIFEDKNIHRDWKGLVLLNSSISGAHIIRRYWRNGELSTLTSPVIYILTQLLQQKKRKLRLSLCHHDDNICETHSTIGYPPRKCYTRIKAYSDSILFFTCGSFGSGAPV